MGVRKIRQDFEDAKEKALDTIERYETPKRRKPLQLVLMPEAMKRHTTIRADDFKRQYPAAGLRHSQIQRDVLSYFWYQSDFRALPFNNVAIYRPDEGKWRKPAFFRKGVPDIHLEYLPAGISAWIEVKTDDDKMRPDQIEFQLECRQWNIPHLVAYNIDDAEKFANEIRAREKMRSAA